MWGGRGRLPIRQLMLSTYRYICSISGVRDLRDRAPPACQNSENSTIGVNEQIAKCCCAAIRAIFKLTSVEADNDR